MLIFFAIKQKRRGNAAGKPGTGKIWRLTSKRKMMSIPKDSGKGPLKSASKRTTGKNFGTIPQKKVMVQTGLLNYLPPLQRGIEGDLTPWQTCAL
jgi:hypothetical protein